MCVIEKMGNCSWRFGIVRLAICIEYIYLRLKQMNAIKFKTDMSPFTLHTHTHTHKLQKLLLVIRTDDENTKMRGVSEPQRTAYSQKTHKIVRLLGCCQEWTTTLNRIQDYFIFLWRKHSHTCEQRAHRQTDNSPSHTRSTHFPIQNFGGVFDSSSTGKTPANFTHFSLTMPIFSSVYFFFQNFYFYKVNGRWDCTYHIVST